MEALDDGSIHDRSPGSQSSITRLPEVSFAFALLLFNIRSLSLLSKIWCFSS